MKNVYENSFVHGRELTKKLVILTCVTCAMSVLFIVMGNQPLQIAFMAVSFVALISTIYTMAKYCVCPHCGKHITMGLLAIENCPRCRRNLVTGKKGKKNKR